METIKNIFGSSVRWIFFCLGMKIAAIQFSHSEKNETAATVIVGAAIFVRIKKVRTEIVWLYIDLNLMAWKLAEFNRVFAQDLNLFTSISCTETEALNN